MYGAACLNRNKRVVETLSTCYLHELAMDIMPPDFGGVLKSCQVEFGDI